MSFDQKTPAKPTNIRQKLSYKEAYAMAIRMHQAWEQARMTMKEQQDKKRHDIDLHHQEVDFKARDKVWMSTKDQKTQRPSHKLDH